METNMLPVQGTKRNADEAFGRNEADTGRPTKIPKLELCPLCHEPSSIQAKMPTASFMCDLHLDATTEPEFFSAVDNGLNSSLYSDFDILKELANDEIMTVEGTFRQIEEECADAGTPLGTVFCFSGILRPALPDLVDLFDDQALDDLDSSMEDVSGDDETNDEDEVEESMSDASSPGTPQSSGNSVLMEGVQVDTDK